MKFSAIEDAPEEIFDDSQFRSAKKNIIGGDDISINPTRIAVFGVGGGGVNAINHMARAKINGVDLYAANTDVQTLITSVVENVIPLGKKKFKGLGVGGDPLKGAEAAKEMIKDVEKVIAEYEMVFFASGFGGGTGTGATPVLAEIAKDLGILTVGVITMPFTHEGELRSHNAIQGLEDIESILDSLIVIPNDNILRGDVISPDAKIEESFSFVNKILSDSVSAITDIITIPGTINIDFADIDVCLRSAGRVSIGVGLSDAKDNNGGSAHRATDIALKNKVIDKENTQTLQNAKHIIVNAVAGTAVSTQELMAIPQIIMDRAKGNKPVLKYGYRIRKDWDNQVKVTIIASSDGVGRGFNFDAHSITNKKREEKPLNSFDQYYNKNEEVNISSHHVDTKSFEKISQSATANDDDSLMQVLSQEEYQSPALERLVESESPIL